MERKHQNSNYGRILPCLIGLLLPLAAFAAPNDATPQGQGKLLKTIVINMGADTTVTNAQYNKYFKEGSAEQGVKAILAAGSYSINGYPIPATEAQCKAAYPKGYTVNQSPWLSMLGSSWTGGMSSMGGPKTFSSYAEAALATATAIPAGLEVKLYDTNADGFTDVIETRYLEAFIVNSIAEKGDGTVIVTSGALTPVLPASTTDGRAFDNTRFTATSGEAVSKANFDPSIHVGDVALFWYGPQGWSLKRAQEVRGLFVDGEDHKDYQIDDVRYQDAMRFSRDGVIISNRPGEFANAQKYFGLNNNTEGLKVSLWLSPTTDYPQTKGAPIGFTTKENAEIFLTKALVVAQKKLDSAVVSADGKTLAAGTKWTTKAAHDELSAAIDRAKATLGAKEPPAFLDYQLYLLYLTLNGTKNDIGASFGGYQYTGFDHLVSTK